MRVLVIGARGFVGVALVSELLRRGHTVIGMEVRADPGRLMSSLDQIEMHVGDCSDPETILHAIGRRGVDAIYYGPFYRSPSRSKNLNAELRVMGVGALNVFNLTRVLDIRRVVFPSSTAVHGVQSPHEDAVNEDSYVKPFGIYGATKLACEYLGADVNAEIGRKAVTSVRLPSIYGPGAEIASRRVNALAVAAGRGGVGRVDYRQDTKVCIAHVDDTAHFLSGLLEKESVVHDVYELGGLSVTFGEIATAVSACAPGAVHEFGNDTVSPLPFKVDSSRAAAEFRLRHRDLEAGMRSVVEYERSRASRSSGRGR